VAPDRLHLPSAAGGPGGTEPSETAGPGDSSQEAVPTASASLAVRVLELGERTADQTLSEVQLEAARVRETAATEAARTRVKAEDSAAALVAAARTEAGEILARARNEAEVQHRETQDRRDQEVAELERRCHALRGEVRDLEVIERRIRERLTAVLHEHLLLVEQPGTLRAIPVPAS
jgi:regulator of protease activity HflC (stomatin/prohibitin superfamily)